MYKVIDVAKMFSVSKVTIYKKITAKKNELKGHIVKKKNITYLDDEAVEIIRSTLQVNQEKVSGRLIDEELNAAYDALKSHKETIDRLKAEKIAMLNDQVLDLESMSRYLNSQVSVKKAYLKQLDANLFDINEAVKYQKHVIDQLELHLKTHDNNEII